MALSNSHMEPTGTLKNSFRLQCMGTRPCFSATFTKANSFLDLHFASLEDEALLYSSIK